MISIKSQYDPQMGNLGDFRDPNVRRLHGQLQEVKAHVEQALSKFETLLAAGQEDLTIYDVQKDDDLRYAIESIFGSIT
jgi:hypothetical protein